ncbi:JmjC domain-containing protein [Bdellovibrio bacteriovorus]|uniref:JmjC domain-containing protein n=1 Tax=Bdellovibrio TaxID=958 RepID=UPI0035A881D8
MSILEKLLTPLSFSDFSNQFLHLEEPYAAPDKAFFMKNLISWPFLQEVLASQHKDCWLPLEGKLPEEQNLNTGILNIQQVLTGFQNRRTLLIRRAETAHPVMSFIAQDFQSLFHCPIDIQIYCTPAQQEGFDWHYDLDDVFVVQTCGDKEFRLRKNTTTPRPLDPLQAQREYFIKEPPAPEIRCWLKAGDWLYIPAGYWHKARALTDSFHLSIGVHRRESPLQHP